MRARGEKHDAKRISERTKRRRIFLGLIFCFCAYFVYTFARIQILRGNAARLIQSGDSFPRDYFVGEQNQNELIYVVMGDSTAVGVGANSLEETVPFQVATSIAAARGRRVRVQNLAVSGARLRDVLQNQMPQMEKLKPEIISISIGANDATHFSSSAQYEKEIGDLISKLDAQQATILLANTPNMGEVPALPTLLGWTINARAKTQNRILEKSLSQNRAAKSNIEIVDLFKRGKLVYARNPEFYASDLFHPAAGGYRIWAELFAEKLQNETPVKSSQ